MPTKILPTEFSLIYRRNAIELRQYSSIHGIEVIGNQQEMCAASLLLHPKKATKFILIFTPNMKIIKTLNYKPFEKQQERKCCNWMFSFKGFMKDIIHLKPVNYTSPKLEILFCQTLLKR